MKNVVIATLTCIALSAAHAEKHAHNNALTAEPGTTLEEHSERAFLRGVARGQAIPEDQLPMLKQRYKLLKKLAKEAETAKLNESIEMRANLRVQRMQILAQAFIADWASKNMPAEADIKALYDEKSPSLRSEPQYEASHILLETEEQAVAVIAALEKGGDFAALAKEKSTDPGSGKSGGALGKFSSDVMIPEFMNALKAMKVGTMSKAPVKSQFGYHIIHYTAFKEGSVPTYEALKASLTKELHDEMVQTYISEMADAITP